MIPTQTHASGFDKTAVQPTRHPATTHRTAMAHVASLLMLCATMAMPTKAAAGERSFVIRGFGTVGLAYSSSPDGDYVANVAEPSGAGRSHRWDTGLDSKLGVQVDARLSEQLTGTLQLVSQRRPDNTFRPRVEWANFKYAVTPELSVRLGRIALPAYQAGDSRLVGVTNLWIRPPLETYNSLIITNSDGFDVLYKSTHEDTSNRVQILYGAQHQDLAVDTGAGIMAVPEKSRNMIGVFNTYESGPFSLRLGALASMVSFFGTTQRATLYNAGLSYDKGHVLLQGEASITELRNITAMHGSIDLVAGYRVNGWTPYLMYAQVSPLSHDAGVRIFEQRTVAAGVRWEFSKTAQVKIQLDHVMLSDGSQTGYFINTRNGFPYGGAANIVSTVVDFVF